MTRRGLVNSNRSFAHKLHLALTREEVSEIYLSSVQEVIHASGIGLYELDADHGKLVAVRATVSNRMLDEYENYGRAADPVLDYVNKYQRPIDSSRLDHKVWRESGALHAIRESGYVHSLGAPVLVRGMRFGTFNLARTADEPPFSDVDLATARVVSEHLGLAIERAHRFESMTRRASSIEHAADRMPQPMVVTDLNGAILFRNKAARNSAVPYLAEERFTETSDIVSVAVADALATFRDQGKRVATQRVMTEDNRNFIIKILRLPDEEGAAMSLFYELEDRSPENRLPTWELLSRREQEIANLVSEGLTTKQIAQRAFISENTVKQHLKRVFAKTNVSSRAELVQLIWHTSSSATSK